MCTQTHVSISRVLEVSKENASRRAVAPIPEANGMFSHTPIYENSADCLQWVHMYIIPKIYITGNVDKHQVAKISESADHGGDPNGGSAAAPHKNPADYGRHPEPKQIPAMLVEDAPDRRMIVSRQRIGLDTIGDRGEPRRRIATQYNYTGQHMNNSPYDPENGRGFLISLFSYRPCR